MEVTMVTIEQKVLLFSKLINQLMNTQFKEGLTNLEEEYSGKLEKNKKDTDLEVKKIINSANKKRDLEISRAYSSLKINEKREYMLVKEKCFNKLMDSLKAHIDEFIKSDIYKDYLLKLVNEFSLEKKHMNNITMYVTDNDYNKYFDIFNKALKDLGYNDDDYKIAVTKDKIIGGFVVEDNIEKLRIDLSIKSLLDDNKPYIMQILFEALEEGGNNE